MFPLVSVKLKYIDLKLELLENLELVLMFFFSKIMP